MPDPSRLTIVAGADHGIGAAECLAREGHVKDEGSVTTYPALHTAGGARC